MNVDNLITEMNADYLKHKAVGNFECAEKIQHEMCFAISNPLLYALEVNVRQIMNLPTLGMWSGMRNAARLKN